MTIEQIMQTIGCSETQARELLSHVAATPKVERGTWQTTQRTIKFCADGPCHDGCQLRAEHGDRPA